MYNACTYLHTHLICSSGVGPPPSPVLLTLSPQAAGCSLLQVFFCPSSRSVSWSVSGSSVNGTTKINGWLNRFLCQPNNQE